MTGIVIQLFQFTLSDQSLKPTRQDRRGIWDLNKQLSAKLTMPRPYSEDLRWRAIWMKEMLGFQF